MMDIKQKSLLIITVAALGFLAYQIFQLVDRDITETPTVVENTMPSSFAMADTPIIKKPQHQLIVRSVNTKKSFLQPASSDPLSQDQHTYVQMLNQFELLKLHRQLLEEETAVATAENQIAQLHSQTAKLVGTGNVDDSGVPNNDASLTLSYVDQQDGQWSATLHIGNAYQSVARGSVLADGYEVVEINHTGVVLQKNQTRELLTFDGITALPSLAPTAPVVAPAPVLVPHIVVTAVPVKKTVAVAVVPPVVKTIASITIKKIQQVAPASPAVVKKMALLNSQPKQTPMSPKQSPAPMSVKITLPAKATVTKSVVAPVIQLSIHDQYAQDDEDDLQNNELSQELHLPSVEIQPVVDQQVYNVGSYLAQHVIVPQTYHLESASASTNETQYAIESADDVATSVATPVAITSSSLLAAPQHAYTIQLIGSRVPAVIEHYVFTNKLAHQSQVATFHLKNGRHPWVIVVYGVYSNQAKAQAARMHLPKHLRANGAWVREVADIKKDLKINNPG